MKSRQAFWTAFLGGVAAPAMAFATPPTPVVHAPSETRSDLDAMRGDWVKIGGDISNVITREKTEYATA